MKLTFRWYSADDAIPLQYIRQISGMCGIVSAVYDVPVGGVWPQNSIAAIKKQAEDNALAFEVVESVPVHEDIKLGCPAQDGYIAHCCENVRGAGQNGDKGHLQQFYPGCLAAFRFGPPAAERFHSVGL